MSIKSVMLEISDTGSVGEYTAKKLNSAVDLGLSYAHQYTDSVGDVLEATVEGYANKATQKAEAELQSLITSGIDKVYSAMGINEESISLAKKIITIGQNSVSAIQTIVPLIPTGVESSPAPKNYMTALTASMYDILYNQYTQLKAIYDETIAPLLVIGDNIIEVLKEAADMIIDAAMEQADIYVFQYTGYHMVEIMQLCKKGIAIIRAIKRKKAEKRKQKEQEEQEEQAAEDLGQPIMHTNKRSKSIKVDVDEKQLKKDLLEWLKQQADGIYNAFMMLYIKEQFESIKAQFAMLTNGGIEQIAERINDLDSVVELLDELGLGSNTPGITLQEALDMGMNKLKAVGTSLKNQAMSQATKIVSQAKSLATVENATQAASIVASNTQVTQETSETFTIDTEIYDTYTNIKLDIYKEPTGSVKRQITKQFENVKQDGKQVFDQATIKNIQNACTEAWSTGSKQIATKCQVGGRVVQYVFTITKKQQATEEKVLHQKKEEDESTVIQKNTNALEDFLGVTLSDETLSELGEHAILEVVKVLFSMLKQILPFAKTIATLIQNYKINKKQAKGVSLANLIAAIKRLKKKLGLTKEKSIENKNLYTVRTAGMRDYCVQTLEAEVDSDGWAEIDKAKTAALIEKLYRDNASTDELNAEFATALYFDMRSIAASESGQAGAQRDGTKNALSTIEVIQDENLVLYTEDQKLTSPSQIMRAIENKIEPF